MNTYIKRNISTLLILLFFVILAVGSTDSDTTTSSTNYVDINARVSFDGTQFIITNNDNSNWYNVELQINPGVFDSGYVYKANLLEAGKTYTIGAMQFANSDGKRFNPFEYKPQKIWISCTINGKEGFWSGEW